jgi:hypothetical protein
VFHNETAEVSEMWVSRFSYFLLSFTKSDSLELINACNAVIEVWSPYTAIMAECFFFKASTMPKVAFQHCPREANEVAHQLAKSAYSSKYFEKKEQISLNKFVYFSFLILAINIFTTMI